jgi:glycine cleavage system H lipoate-binding protein
MKKRILIFLVLANILPGWLAAKTSTAEKNSNEEQVILMASKNLSKTAETLTREYPHKGSTIEINSIDQPTKNLSEILANSPGGFFDESMLMQANNPGWKLIIGREITVAVVSSRNPFIDILKKEGLSIVKFAGLVKGESDWGSVLHQPKSSPADVFTIDGVTIPESANDFLGIQDGGSAKFLTQPEFLSTIQNNPNSIGLCRLNDVLDSDRKSLAEGVVLLPFDNNNNGQLDYHEQIYGSVENFLRGVWIGKFPNQLVTNIYFVSNSQPQSQEVKDFLSWIVTDGQQYLNTAGINELTASERLSKLEKINPALNLKNEAEVNQTGTKWILAIAGLIVLAGGVFFLFAYRRKRLAMSHTANFGREKTINENILSMPNGLYFDKTHTWIYLEKDGLAKIGIDDFLLHVTGNFTRVKMKEPGCKIKKGETILSLIQNGKQISLYSPVSGTIKEMNDMLVTHPTTISESPYEDGWVYQVEPSNWLREIQFLNLATVYKDWVKSEFIRLKDFLSIYANRGLQPMVTFQEGGELKNNILQELGPELWEEFQNNFINQRNN